MEQKIIQGELNKLQEQLLLEINNNIILFEKIKLSFCDNNLKATDMYNIMIEFSKFKTNKTTKLLNKIHLVQTYLLQLEIEKLIKKR